MVKWTPDTMAEEELSTAVMLKDVLAATYTSLEAPSEKGPWNVTDEIGA